MVVLSSRSVTFWFPRPRQSLNVTFWGSTNFFGVNEYNYMIQKLWSRSLQLFSENIIHIAMDAFYFNTKLENRCTLWCVYFKFGVFMFALPLISLLNGTPEVTSPFTDSHTCQSCRLQRTPSPSPNLRLLSIPQGLKVLMRHSKSFWLSSGCEDAFDAAGPGSSRAESRCLEWAIPLSQLFTHRFRYMKH